MKRVKLLIGLFAVIALVFAQTAWAQDTKRLRIIVPYPPGGTADALPRLISERLGSFLGQTIVIENRPGAGANIGAELVARSDPDGQTLLVVAPHVLTTNHLLYKLSFDPAAFAPVSIIATYPIVLLVNPRVPANTLQELIAYAKANPGKLNFASQGSGTSSHLTGEMFNAMSGAKMVHVPYKGTGPALIDLLGGQVQVLFDNLPATMQYIKAGRLRILGVGSAHRLSVLPEVPAIAEVLPGFLSETWMGLVAPPKTPLAITTRISTAVAEAVRVPDIAARLMSLNAEPVGNTPAQMAEIVRQDKERWVGVIRAANVTAD